MQRHITKRHITTFAAMLLAALVSASALAQSPGDRADRRPDRRDQAQERVEQFGEARERLAELAAEFGLSDEQRDAILAIVEAGAAEAREIGSEMLANHDELTTAITSEPVDHAAIELIAAEQAGLATDLVRNRADTLGQMRDVLSDDQLGMITELRSVLQQRFAGFVEASQPRRDRRRALLVMRRGTRADLRELADDHGLSPDQRADIRAILEQSVPETLATLQDMAANRQELTAAVAAEPFDPATVEAIATGQGTLFGELVVRHAESMIAIRGVLSDEQLGFIADLRELLQARFTRVVEALHL